MANDLHEIHSRESAFHDTWAQETDIKEIDVTAFHSAPTALELKIILDFLGDVSGKRILDLGCGLGEASVMFAQRGARVTSLDISPEAVGLAVTLAAYHGVSITGVTSEAEKLPFDDSAFDIVYVGSVLHHISDHHVFFQEVSRVLVTGGKFAAFEPLKYNPLINVYRRIATEVRSADERPLGRNEVRRIAAYFSETKTVFCWIAALMLFLKYFLVDRVLPNKERYWKRIYKETERSLWWWLPLEKLDRCFLTRIPLFQWLSWNIVILAVK